MNAEINVQHRCIVPAFETRLKQFQGFFTLRILYCAKVKPQIN